MFMASDTEQSSFRGSSQTYPLVTRAIFRSGSHSWTSMMYSNQMLGSL